MCTNGSRSARSTPAKARRTGKPSPSRPPGAALTPRTRRNRASAGTADTRSSVVGSSTVIAGMSFPGTRGSRGLFRLPDHHRERVVLDLDLESGLVREGEHDALHDRWGVAEPDALAAPGDPADRAMGTDVEEARLGEVDRHGAHAPPTSARQQYR